MNVLGWIPGSRAGFQILEGERDLPDPFRPFGEREAFREKDGGTVFFLHDFPQVARVRQEGAVQIRAVIVRVNDEGTHGRKQFFEIAEELVDGLDDEGAVGGIKGKITQRRAEIFGQGRKQQPMRGRDGLDMDFLHVPSLFPRRSAHGINEA
jgi:hypothetical protein